MIGRLSVLIILSGTLVAHAAQEEPKNTTATLITLEQAVERTFQASPRLLSASDTFKAAQATLTQAALSPNPQLSVQAENVLGGGKYNGIQNAEFTYSIGQTIEFGGKRSARQAVANYLVGRSEQDLEIEKLDLIRDVTIAYADAVLADEITNLAREQKILSGQVFSEVDRRVRNARESTLQKIQANLELSEASLNLARAVREKKHAVHVLSSHWSGHDRELALEKNRFIILEKPPTEERIETALSQSLIAKRWTLENSRRKAMYDLEHASAFPDLHLSVGLRQLVGTSDFAMVAGVSLPLPILNQNQGNVYRALSEWKAIESDSAATLTKLQNESFEQLEKSINAYERALALRDKLLPDAQKAFTAVYEGYILARYSFLELMNVKKLLFAMKEQYLVTLHDYFVARSELKRILGKDLFCETRQEIQHAE